MKITQKDASITNTDDEFPGSFEVVLSAPTKDRDGDTLLPDEWKQPLPDKITFDSDHGMSVATTVGSGVPSINDAGELVVSGTYSSLPRAQEVRTLVNEGHINTTSVAFMTERSTAKDGTKTVTRELLNGAFVAIPSNREALVLSSKAATVKVGARNSATDAEHIQAIHDHAVALGAKPSTEDDEKKSFTVDRKTVGGSFEEAQCALGDAVHALYPTDDIWAYVVATFPDSVVYRVSGGADTGQWQASYTIGDDGTATLGTPERVNLVEQILPVSKSVHRKDADTDADDDPADLISATDAAIDEAIDLFSTVDLTDLPPAVAQAVALVQAADTAIDKLMSVVGIPDPDEDADTAGASSAPVAGAAKAAPAAGTKDAPAEEAESVTAKDLEAQALRIQAAQFI
ncbi:hypothetical protein HII28_02155 [Planctomonas sp. JC2975]|uniref:hypothetical protein n=1 Tax=Planctomonas sp. JC2975 TaxID=2729626 RepID=UPI00147675DD|nr:hypothetical protein [Planctomonas sp. JC2975]NNC10690.1 hypothetical protein [Planctomonas sp. JC2975]